MQFDAYHCRAFIFFAYIAGDSWTTSTHSLPQPLSHHSLITGHLGRIVLAGGVIGTSSGLNHEVHDETSLIDSACSNKFISFSGLWVRCYHRIQFHHFCNWRKFGLPNHKWGNSGQVRCFREQKARCGSCCTRRAFHWSLWCDVRWLNFFFFAVCAAMVKGTLLSNKK